MHKGLGFYTPNEATVFFLKSLLLSFWIGVDLIAALLVSTFSSNVFERHSVLFLASLATLVFGTVLSALFAWATGSLFGRKLVSKMDGVIADKLQNLKLSLYKMVGIGIITVVAFLIVAIGYLSHLRQEGSATQSTGRVDIAVAKKCAEVARLEGKLFHSDEQSVLSGCLIQYGEKSAALHN